MLTEFLVGAFVGAVAVLVIQRFLPKSDKEVAEAIEIARRDGCFVNCPPKTK